MSLKPSVAHPTVYIKTAPTAKGIGNDIPPTNHQEQPHTGSLLTVLIAVGANVIIAIAKTVAAFMTGSASMIAEAAHSWADAGNGTLLVVAEKKSVKPADKSHPLGYGKESYVWSMIAAFGVFTAGSIVSIYNGIKEWNAPAGETDYTVGFIVLAVALVLEGGSLFQAYRESKKHGDAMNISALGYVIDTSNPTLGIRVESENIQARTIRHTNSCYFTMVAIDENGKPTPVPPLEIKSALQQCRFDAAIERKKLRMEGSKRPSCDISDFVGELEGGKKDAKDA